MRARRRRAAAKPGYLDDLGLAEHYFAKTLELDEENDLARRLLKALRADRNVRR